jgi:hypothetical protein
MIRHVVGHGLIARLARRRPTVVRAVDGISFEIASGERKWVPVIREFYGPFSESIGRAEQTMERVRDAVKSSPRRGENFTA